jgi:diphthamide synthase subunit DPH2
MKITICGSIDFTYEIKEIADKLEKAGHQTEIPLTSQRILEGELTLDEFKKEKERNGDGFVRKVKLDVIKRYYEIIKASDAILVVNLENKKSKNYIGGNTFLEMGFAHVLNKKIFLLNPIPEAGYKDEMLAMQPVVINGDLSEII